MTNTSNVSVRFPLTTAKDFGPTGFCHYHQEKLYDGESCFTCASAKSNQEVKEMVLEETLSSLRCQISLQSMRVDEKKSRAYSCQYYGNTRVAKDYNDEYKSAKQSLDEMLKTEAFLMDGKLPE